MKKPATAANGSSVVTPKSSAKKSRGPPQNSVDTFAVQCNDCFKWRTIPTEYEFEEYRIMDKPNIPKTSKGFQRIVFLRRDYSKMDVYYVTPDGTRVRATPGIIAYLKEHPEYSDFTN
nr:methyl-CpG-binding domain-containing protein 4-like [Tanacetum cinerariifolium]GEX38821.1 methyl-CpG-binding domain-containing protein 4-like [Tanacetum cinerariifolium]